MNTQASRMMLRAAILAVIPLLACSPVDPVAGGSATAPPRTMRPAAPVPTVTLREAQAGTPVVAEAGDHIEVHLSATETGARWQFLGQTGNILTLEGSRLGTVGNGGEHGPPVQVFRFSTTAAGRSELHFAWGTRTLTFIIDVR